jgi:CHASE2 domain-containing sensor protein
MTACVDCVDDSAAAAATVDDSVVVIGTSATTASSSELTLTDDSTEVVEEKASIGSVELEETFSVAIFSELKLSTRSLTESMSGVSEWGTSSVFGASPTIIVVASVVVIESAILVAVGRLSISFAVGSLEITIIESVVVATSSPLATVVAIADVDEADPVVETGSSELPGVESEEEAKSGAAEVMAF